MNNSNSIEAALEEVYARFAEQAAAQGYSPDELVFGSGNPNSRIVLVGEAPGREEVAAGRPFVGRAGKNLTRFLQETGIEREELYITNAVKFRPYKVSPRGTRSNRPPNARERALCARCLAEELGVLAPGLVVTLGNTAMAAVCGPDAPAIGELHGSLLEAGGERKFAVFALYHPASIIYRPALEETYWQDLRELRRVHGLFTQLV